MIHLWKDLIFFDLLEFCFAFDPASQTASVPWRNKAIAGSVETPPCDGVTA